MADCIHENFEITTAVSKHPDQNDAKLLLIEVCCANPECKKRFEFVGINALTNVKPEDLFKKPSVDVDFIQVRLPIIPSK